MYNEGWVGVGVGLGGGVGVSGSTGVQERPGVRSGVHQQSNPIQLFN